MVGFGFVVHLRHQMGCLVLLGDDCDDGDGDRVGDDDAMVMVYHISV